MDEETAMPFAENHLLKVLTCSVPQMTETLRKCSLKRMELFLLNKIMTLWQLFFPVVFPASSISWNAC
jgi:hypothetical protein